MPSNASPTELGRWGMMMSIKTPPEGATLAQLADKWEAAAREARQWGTFEDECDTLEHCARELRAWLEATEPA